MDAVVGSWRIKKGSEKGHDEFLKTLGLPEEAVKLYKSREFLLTFSKDGDKIVMMEVVDNDPAKKSATYTFEMGTELDTLDIDGTPLKIKMEWDGTKFNETYTYPNYPPVHTTREVVGGVMKVAMTIKGVTATEEWEKC